MPFSRTSRQSAFSLIEIALVLVIVVLIVTALIPAFRGQQAERRYKLQPPQPSPTPAFEVPPAFPFPPATPAGAKPTEDVVVPEPVVPEQK